MAPSATREAAEDADRRGDLHVLGVGTFTADVDAALAGRGHLGDRGGDRLERLRLASIVRVVPGGAVDEERERVDDAPLRFGRARVGALVAVIRRDRVGRVGIASVTAAVGADVAAGGARAVGASLVE